jgi:mono/diheme cytochrome c family protein
VGFVAAAAAWVLSSPSPGVRALPARTPDPANGETIYHAGSCIACHRAAVGSASGPKLPAGGSPFRTPVGTFYPGNLTPDLETGIGRWSAADFVDAMTDGVSPQGTHYFPAFPYTSYRFVKVEDLLDLRAYLMSLPEVRSAVRRAEVPLLPLARRGVGLWKRLALGGEKSFRPEQSRGPVWNRGAYLVKGPGHCGECHTPRNVLMVMKADRWLRGGKHPAGEGQVPSLVGQVARGNYKDAADLALALRNGEGLGYEHLASGGMGAIQSNLALLPEGAAKAIAEYLVSLE